MSSISPRVVITGMGMVCPLGSDKTALWDALISARSAIEQLTDAHQVGGLLKYAAAACQFQGEIENFGVLEKEQKKAIRKGSKMMCRESQMGVAAAQMALGDAGLTPGEALNA
ncbi:MAG: beta-ketoacyl synthase N-terminal-like domain-containing protein, partial [Thermoguttaceae bacterium]